MASRNTKPPATGGFALVTGTRGRKAGPFAVYVAGIIARGLPSKASTVAASTVALFDADGSPTTAALSIPVPAHVVLVPRTLVGAAEPFGDGNKSGARARLGSQMATAKGKAGDAGKGYTLARVNVGAGAPASGPFALALYRKS